MSEIAPLDKEVLSKAMASITAEGARGAAEGFSGMAGCKIQVNKATASLKPMLAVPSIVGRPDDDAVGIYLRFQGDLVGQIMLVTPLPKALKLTDMLMGLPAGTTQQLGTLERSALGELGNMCGSFFLNAVAKSVDASFRPSPPAVMVDMVGAILDIVVATTGYASEDVLLVQASFTDDARSIDVDFWVIPDMTTLNALISKRPGT